MESLRSRNERLAAEVSRLHTENKILKSRIRKLLSRVLGIPEKGFRNRGVQTTGSAESMLVAKPLNENRMSPTTTFSPDARKKLNSGNPFRYSPPLYNLLDLEVFSKPSPDRSNNEFLGNYRSSPNFGGNNSPSTEKLVPQLPSSTTSIDSDVALDYQFMQTPTRTLFCDENYPTDGAKVFDRSLDKEIILDNQSKILRRFGTPLHVPPNTRERRTVSRVLSYKEPSLNIKVRKGFKFFTFED